MAKTRRGRRNRQTRKPLLWLHGEVKTPPFTAEGRQEAGGEPMDSKKRKALQAAGWKVGDAADFLGMDDEERQLLDARIQLALAVRRQRVASHLSQRELGLRLKTSQPRVAKIERAASDVSLDQLVRAFSAAGGKIHVKAAPATLRTGAAAKKRVKDAVVFEVVTSE